MKQRTQMIERDIQSPPSQLLNLNALKSVGGGGGQLEWLRLYTIGLIKWSGLVGKGRETVGKVSPPLPCLQHHVTGLDILPERGPPSRPPWAHGSAAHRHAGLHTAQRKHFLLDELGVGFQLQHSIKRVFSLS